MHILLGLAAVLGVVAVWLIRLNMAAKAAHDLKDEFDSARGAYRRAHFRKQAEQNPLESISDPREAAAALLTAIAQTDRRLGEAQEAHLVELFGGRMEMGDPKDALAMTDYGIDFASVVGRGSVFGAQPHPEKSQEVGLRLLRNFAQIVAQKR